MGLAYYNNYLNSLARSPNETWRGIQQATISHEFDDTTIQKTVLEENIPFDFQFTETQCWVGTVTDALTNTIKDVEDYRSLYFENCSHDTTRGRYYQWNNNYWMIYDTITELETIATCKMRRCNNIAKWVDKDTGEIIEYPCILDYEISSVNVQYTKDVATANSKVTLILQGNENTHKLIKNNRLIFNQVPYKIVAYNNFMQDDYITKETPLLFLELYLDQEMPSDDMINNIANRYDYTYSLSIQQDNIEQVSGFSGQLTEQVTYNNNIVNMGVVWSSSDDSIVTVDSNGNYNIIGTTVGSSATITCAIDGNSNVYDAIAITVASSIVSDKTLVVTQVTELSQYDSVTIDANVYDNGEKQTDVVTCVSNWSNSVNYTLVDNGNNSWMLINNKQTSLPLVLTFTSGTLSQQLTIKLNGYM